jgi:hypothetical protein
MTDTTVEREAFINLPSEAEMRAHMPPGVSYPYDFGFIPAMGRLLSAHPRLAGPMRGFFNEVMFAPGVLSRAEREMVAAVTSAAQSCEF